MLQGRGSKSNRSAKVQIQSKNRDCFFVVKRMNSWNVFIKGIFNVSHVRCDCIAPVLYAEFDF